MKNYTEYFLSNVHIALRDIWENIMILSRATQSHLVGHMLPARHSYTLLSLPSCGRSVTTKQQNMGKKQEKLN
jgi:hypothetical protein